MQIEIYDPTTFVDFEFAKDKPVALGGAPPQCLLTVDLPHEPTPAEQLRLSQLDNVPLDASSTYGETFAAVLQAGNVYGAQFHPEKS